MIIKDIITTSKNKCELLAIYCNLLDYDKAINLLNIIDFNKLDIDDNEILNLICNNEKLMKILIKNEEIKNKIYSRLKPSSKAKFTKELKMAKKLFGEE